MWPSVVGLAFALLAAGRAPAAPVIGDCSDDGLVAVNELIAGVTIALGDEALASCPAFDADGSATVSVAELIAAVNQALYGGLDPAFVFIKPVANQLSLTTAVAVEVDLPADALTDTFELRLDGAVVPDTAAATTGGAAGRTTDSLTNVPAGAHALQARVRVERNGATVTVIADVAFEAVTLTNPDTCEVLNNVECILPYPSSRFLEPADTPTGYRLAFPTGGIPPQNGAPLSPEPYRVLDGFSPTVQILMHFPGGVDPERSNASRLLPATRTSGTRSLDADSPTVLLDAETGERLLHFIEVDARVADPARQLVFLRPGKSLTPGRRYVVAVRNLVHPDGTPVQAEAAFAALRDERPTDIAAIEARRTPFADLFARLDQAGIARDTLVLAFDFVVQSDEGLTTQMRAMRDEAFAFLAAHTGEQTFTVTKFDEADCDAPGVTTWRIVEGTYQVPLFLTRDPIVDRAFPAPLSVDGAGRPVVNGLTNPPFTISLPCKARRGEPVWPVVLGHGLLGTGRGFVYDLRDLQLEYIGGATDWWGLSSPDLNEPNSLTSFLSAGVILNLNNVAALSDRLRQGQLNTLVLGRMMKTGAFNTHPAFQRDGVGVFPGPEEDEFYFGASLGGIMGLMFSALSPDVENVHVDVPAINFSILLQRATPFIAFETALELTGLVDPMHQAMLITLIHELWVRGESAGYATHITRDPLPDTNAKNILLSVAYLDQQVSNQASEITARTLRLPNLEGSLVSGLAEIPDQPGPLSSAYVVYDTGSFDLANPAHAPFIPPLANMPPEPNDCDPHGRQALIPAALQQVLGFLEPGGQIENFCTGTCDAGEPFEIPEGAAAPCDPLAP